MHFSTFSGFPPFFPPRAIFDSYLAFANLFRERAKFGGASLQKAGLPGSKLDAVDLRQVELAQVNLVNSTLRRANLQGVDMTGATLVKADLSGLVPATYQLSQNYPNPFNPETTLRYALPRDEKVQLKVFNIRGQLVKTLVNEDVKAGHHSVIWKGRDDADQMVASGIYFVQMQAGDYRQARKLVLIK